MSRLRGLLYCMHEHDAVRPKKIRSLARHWYRNIGPVQLIQIPRVSLFDQVWV